MGTLCQFIAHSSWLDQYKKSFYDLIKSKQKHITFKNKKIGATMYVFCFQCSQYTDS